MSFLNPLALIGFALLSIPVLAHIFKPRRVREMPFSSLRWLRHSQHRMSRRIQWHQILLFLLRAAFLSLLILALAQPVISFGGNEQPAERFVIVDVSGSMAYQPASGDTPLARGKDIAEDLLTGAGAGHRTTVILAGAETQSLGPLTADPSRYVPRLRTAEAQAGGANLSTALQTVRARLHEARSNTRVELFYVTDNHRQNWSPPAIGTFLDQVERDVNVSVIDVSEPGQENLWIANARALDDDTIRVMIGTTTSEPRQRIVELSHLPNQSDQRQQVEVQGLTAVHFELDAPIESDNAVARLALEPTDALPVDDEYWLNLGNPGATRVLLLEPAAQIDRERSASQHLRAALGALNEAAGISIDVTRRAASNVTVSDVRENDVVFMVDVATLSAEAVEAIRRRVDRGGGLAVFLGGNVDTAFYNNQMSTGGASDDALLPVTLGPATQAPGGVTQLSDVQREHPLMKHLFDPTYGGLAQSMFYTYHNIDTPAQNEDAAGQIIARFNDDNRTPAIVSHTVGSGQVLLFNTTANGDWGDMAVQRGSGFVPLIDRVLTQLAGGLGRGTFEISDPVRLPLSDADTDQQVTLTRPDGSTTDIALGQIAGRPALQLDGQRAPGVYRVDYTTTDGGEQNAAFVVQTSRAESPLTPTDTEALEQWWSPASVTVTPVGPGGGGVATGAARYPLAQWLVLLACLALLAEMLLVHTLCPAVNPTVASSFIAQHGMIQSTTSGESSEHGSENGNSAADEQRDTATAQT